MSKPKHVHSEMKGLRANCFKCGRSEEDIVNRPYIPCRVRPGRYAAKIRRLIRARRDHFAAQLAVSA